MTTFSLEISNIPHGHGLSFKRGVADGLLDSFEHRTQLNPTHSASYERGRELGVTLRAEIAQQVQA